MSFFDVASKSIFDSKFSRMSVIYLTLAISTLVAIVFFFIFILSVKKGQYDDTYTPSVRMLFEDELVKDKNKIDIQETSTKKSTNKEN